MQEDRLMADRDECGRNRLAHVADTAKVCNSVYEHAVKGV